MARIEEIEQRLQRWSQYVTVGDGSGFPTMSVIHPEWQPPAPGQTPTLKSVAASDVKETHWAIGRLSQRMANTICVYYCLRGTREWQAELLGCAVQTLHQRIDVAHKLLSTILMGYEMPAQDDEGVLQPREKSL